MLPTDTLHWNVNTYKSNNDVNSLRNFQKNDLTHYHLSFK